MPPKASGPPKQIPTSQTTNNDNYEPRNGVPARSTDQGVWKAGAPWKKIILRAQNRIQKEVKGTHNERNY